MGLTYHHLEQADVREAMLELWSEERIALLSRGHARECYGRDLNDHGWARFEAVMPEALHEQSDEWLASQMKDPDLWRSRRPNKRDGPVNYDRTAALQMLCFGEFNVAYVHGLSRALLERGATSCTVYRADRAYQPRAECSAWEGRVFALRDVFDGHRARYWPPGRADRNAFSVPSGPNCHHSIRAVEVSNPRVSP